jgi:hypothetical protein
MRQRLARNASCARGLGRFGFAYLVVGCLAFAACTQGPAPCLNAGACSEGEECLANRCVPEGGEGVPVDSLRLVCGLSRASGADPLTLEFEPRWSVFENIDAAFLLLDTEGDPGRLVRVRARSLGAQKTQLGIASPTSVGLVEPPGRMRIDVTALVRSWQGSKRVPHAITLQVTDGPPLNLSFGTAHGAPPRLEVYGR